MRGYTNFAKIENIHKYEGFLLPELLKSEKNVHVCFMYIDDTMYIKYNDECDEDLKNLLLKDNRIDTDDVSFVSGMLSFSVRITQKII